MTDGVSTSVFRRSENPLAHGVYGLLLALATVGELLDHGAASGQAVAWLLGAGAVLLAAHVFSDVLAETAATRVNLKWAEVLRVGRAELAVLAGFAGAAAIMTIAAIGEFDSVAALQLCLAAGLLAVAWLSFYSTAHHGTAVRVAMAAAATALGAIIVVLENTL